MLQIVLRKIANNKWMFLCLFIGSIMVVAMVSSIPIYTDGVLQRMLTKDLEEYQVKNGVFPGEYKLNANFGYVREPGDRKNFFTSLLKNTSTKTVESIGLPLLTENRRLAMNYLNIVNEADTAAVPKPKSLQLQAMYELGNHVKVVKGRMYSSEIVNGIYEVVVTQPTFIRYRFKLDEVYNLVTDNNNAQLGDNIKFKIVGIVDAKDYTDPYWAQPISDFNQSFLMDYKLCAENFALKDPRVLSESLWYFAFDYHEITIKNMNEIISSYNDQMEWVGQYGLVLSGSMPIIPTLEQYTAREKQLKMTLWVLLVPILLMLFFYIFMVSQLIVNSEENEIAVMKSRGATGLQIVRIFFIESLILSGISLLLGPPLGLLICTVLGSSNGFLEFIQRTTLPISLSFKSYMYAFAASGMFIISMLIPVFIYSRTTIVQHKQKTARGKGKPFWKKYFVDVLILAVSLYGLYSYNNQKVTMKLVSGSTSSVKMDPLLFLISTFFILGAGLVFLRIFPFIVRFVFWLGRKIWSPELYASFIHVGRSEGQQQFLMIFIILTLSIGIFNANAARTINGSMEDKSKYLNGADVTLKAHWQGIKVSNASTQSSAASSTAASVATSGSGDDIAQYIEPPFSDYMNLDGAEKATKVLRKTGTKVYSGKQWIESVTVMGVIPDEFGEVAWFKPELLPSHWYEYLNTMTNDYGAFLISRSMQEKYKLKEGDMLSIRAGNQGYLEGRVHAVIDYWPGYNPNEQRDEKGKPISVDTIVVNLNYIQNAMPVEPYEVWIRKKPGATDMQIANSIIDKKLDIEKAVYTGHDIIVLKNDPMLQGTNGALTLGFVVSMAISMVGFLIFWILSIKKRVLQFGIFRAMGMSNRKVIGMICAEQILISGTAVVMGIVIGGITSKLFVPLFQFAYNTAQQVLPFEVVTRASDYVKIYGVVGVMLISGFLVLGKIISSIKIDQALKLGED